MSYAMGVLARFRHEKRGTFYEVIAKAAVHVPQGYDNPRELEYWNLVQRHDDRVYMVLPPGLRHRHTPSAEVRWQVAGNQPEDGDTVVIYRAEADGTFWARSEPEFTDGRFIPVNLQAAAMMPSSWHLGSR